MAASQEKSHPKWELRVCAKRGHETYAPTDDDGLHRRLRADTSVGEVWRCLRCGDFVLGPPGRSGPVEGAPEVARRWPPAR